MPASEQFRLLRDLGERSSNPVRLRCGKCNRVLDTVAGDPHDGRLAQAMPTITTALPHRVSTQPATRPYVTKVSSQDPQFAGLDERYVYSCHPIKCGATHTVRMDRLLVAYVRAVRAGVRELRLPLEI